MSWINSHESIWTRNFMGLKVLCTIYVLGIIVTHASLPVETVWPLAVFFSVIMNFTYPWAAVKAGNFFSLETTIASGLIAMSILGLWNPLFVVTAIFLHGVWDLLKHSGNGTVFFKWYTSGCVTVDWFYAGCLFLYWATT